MKNPIYIIAGFTVLFMKSIASFSVIKPLQEHYSIYMK